MIVPIALLLVISVVLVGQLRTLETDRAAGRATIATLIGPTATRVAYSILVVAAFTLLILGWGLGVVPALAIAPLLTAPLAVRLGDIVSHRAGAELEGAQRDAVIFAVAFLALFALGLYLDGLISGSR